MVVNFRSWAGALLARISATATADRMQPCCELLGKDAMAASTDGALVFRPGGSDTPFNAYFSSSGAISRGRMSGISGQMMIAASTRIIGTSMIIVSLSA